MAEENILCTIWRHIPEKRTHKAQTPLSKRAAFAESEMRDQIYLLAFITA
jgi:hypothetical protein